VRRRQINQRLSVPKKRAQRGRVRGRPQHAARGMRPNPTRHRHTPPTFHGSSCRFRGTTRSVSLPYIGTTTQLCDRRHFRGAV
jgi:hypothetical protein